MTLALQRFLLYYISIEMFHAEYTLDLMQHIQYSVTQQLRLSIKEKLGKFFIGMARKPLSYVRHY